MDKGLMSAMTISKLKILNKKNPCNKHFINKITSGENSKKDIKLMTDLLNFIL